MNRVTAFISRLAGRAGLADSLAPFLKPATEHALPASVADISLRRIVQVVDMSGSMAEMDMGNKHTPLSRLDAAKSAVMQFSEAARLGTIPPQLALVAFSEQAHTFLPLTESDILLKMAQALANFHPATSTNMEDGLRHAERLLRPYRGERGLEVHVLTDGKSNEGANPLIAADALKAMGCTLSLVGIGGSPSEVDEALLKAAASRASDGRPLYRFIKDRDQLERHYQTMGDGITR